MRDPRFCWMIVSTFRKRATESWAIWGSVIAKREGAGSRDLGQGPVENFDPLKATDRLWGSKSLQNCSNDANGRADTT